ncbi:MAG TPA: hypothetical protein VI932_03325 [Bacteroidota bacterium]|nr:hypothetical protein [Bacteroidota bacterium]
MRRRLGIIALAAALIGATAAQAGPQVVRATFYGYRGDTRIWTDEITTEKGKIEDIIDGTADNPDREATTLPGTTTGEIFTETLKGILAHNVAVKGEYVNIYDGEGMTGMVMVEDPPLVFDPTFPSHYGMLLEKYSASRGGTQKFSVIIPEKGDYCRVEISPRPPASIPVGETRKESKVYQFRVEYNQYVTVWTLDNAVAAVYVPWKNEYMVDAKYPMLHQKIQMLVKRSM